MHAYLQREIFAVCVKLHDEIWDIFTFVFVLFFLLLLLFTITLSFFPKCKKPFCLFVLVVLGFELRACTLSHSISPFFVLGFFKIGSQELFSQGSLQTMVLLITAS
jgi:hypothetical protein